MSAAVSIAAAADTLRAGGLVAFPTETVYGLGADAFNERAVQEVYRLKGRPSNNPLIVHVSDVEMAKRVVREWPREADELVRRFWPGPLTLVLPKAASVPESVTGGGPNVAVRCPDHPLALELIRAFGGPIVGPSANPSGKVSPTTAAHVRESFPDAELLVLDGGACRAGIESTVLSLAEDEPTVLRLGAIPVEELHLEDATEGVGATFLPPEALEGEGGIAPMASPGRMVSHYAPNTKAVLFDAGEWPDVLHSAGGKKVVVLTHVATRGVIDPHEVIRMPTTSEAYAARLYAAVRQADTKNPALIAIERTVGTGGLWEAIGDRLGRLTAGGG